MENVKFQKNDFKNLERILKINKRYYYKGKYTNVGVIDVLRKYIQPIRAKFTLIKSSLINDPRFSNFEIGMSTIRPRGYKFTDHIFVWMVPKAEYIQRSKDFETAQLYMPQIQVSLKRFGLTTSEIWFERFAIDDKPKLIKFIKGNIVNIKKKYNILVQHHESDRQDKYKLNSYDSGTSFEKALSKFDDPLYKESSLYKFYPSDKMVKMDNVINTIKNDIIELVHDVYNKVYKTNIIDYSLEEILNTKLRNEDDIERRATDSIKYERKHSLLQNALHKYYNSQNIPSFIEKNRIDFIVNAEEEILLMEVKSYDNYYRCVRESLGQIIEYAYKFKDFSGKKIRLIIAGIVKPDAEGVKYFKHLQSKISLELNYFHFDYRNMNEPVEMI